MAEFRRIPMSLFLILPLLFPAVTGQSRPLRVKYGSKVILPCENAINFQDRCENTHWLFVGQRSPEAVELVRAGQIVENARDRSFIRHILGDCSLVIQVVTFDDIGYYFCRQFKSGFGQGQDSVVNLDVFIPDRVHPDLANDTYLSGDGQVTAPAATKSTTAAMRTTDSSIKAGTTAAASAITDAPTEQQARTDCSVVDYIMLALRVAELVLITVITVLLIRAGGNQRPVRRSGAAASQVHQDDRTVNYENVGGPSASVRIKTNIN